MIKVLVADKEDVSLLGNRLNLERVNDYRLAVLDPERVVS